MGLIVPLSERMFQDFQKMPTYEYKCLKCDHLFEAFQSMSADRLTDCPVEECGGDLKRLIGTGAGIIFKGSGFYETDYRSSGYKAAAKADKSSDSSSSSSDSGGGDSKSSTTKKEPSKPSTPAPKPSKSD